MGLHRKVDQVPSTAAFELATNISNSFSIAIFYSLPSVVHNHKMFHFLT